MANNLKTKTLICLFMSTKIIQCIVMRHIRLVEFYNPSQITNVGYRSRFPDKAINLKNKMKTRNIFYL